MWEMKGPQTLVRWGRCAAGGTQLQRPIHLGSRPGPPRQDAGQQTDPLHEPYFPKGNSRALEGYTRACLRGPWGSLRGFPWPGPLPCWRLGPCLLLFLPLLFPLSTARKTPHCMSASPPRVPRTKLSNTSTRYEPPCEKAFWVTQFSAPSRGPRLQRHSPILSESRALGLIPWAFLESLTASPEVPPQLLSSTRYFVGSNLRAGSTRRENLDFHSNVQWATLPARCWGSSSVGQGPWPLPRPSSVFGALYMWPPVSLTPTRGSPRRQRRGHSQRTGEKATAQRGRVTCQVTQLLRGKGQIPALT